MSRQIRSVSFTEVILTFTGLIAGTHGKSRSEGVSDPVSPLPYKSPAQTLSGLILYRGVYVRRPPRVCR